MRGGGVASVTFSLSFLFCLANAGNKRDFWKIVKDMRYTLGKEKNFLVLITGNKKPTLNEKHRKVPCMPGTYPSHVLASYARFRNRYSQK